MHIPEFESSKLEKFRKKFSSQDKKVDMIIGKEHLLLSKNGVY